MKKKALVVVLLFLLAFIGFRIYKNQQQKKTEKKDTNIAIVERDNIIQSIILSGDVSSNDLSKISFGTNGIVDTLLVEEGDKVTQGQLLAKLDDSIAIAGLREAQAGYQVGLAQVEEVSTGQSPAILAVNQAEIQAATEALEKIKAQQDEIVKKAYESLLSTSLAAVPDDPETEARPPLISGVYTGNKEGVYKIKFYASAAKSGYSYFLSGLEGERVETSVSDSPSPLGTQGLYMQLQPEPYHGAYKNTEWTVTIPNTRSSAYVALKAAYENAKKQRDLLITQAENNLKLVQEKYQAGLSGAKPASQQVVKARARQSLAGVEMANARLAQHNLYAPFSGTVADIRTKVGESAGPGIPSITLLNTEDLSIKVFVPETDIEKIKIGQRAEVVFEFDRDKKFAAKVKNIAPTDTQISDATYYEVEVVLDVLAEDYPSLRSGMTVEVSIIISAKNDVLVVPSRFVYQDKDGEYFVWKKLTDQDPVKQPIKLGTKDNNGNVEIVSNTVDLPGALDDTNNTDNGLREGDVVVLEPKE